MRNSAEWSYISIVKIRRLAQNESTKAKFVRFVNWLLFDLSLDFYLPWPTEVYACKTSCIPLSQSMVLVLPTVLSLDTNAPP